MLKFKQKTELEQTYHSTHSLTEPTNSVADIRLHAEEQAPQALQIGVPLMATAGPSLMGIPFARRNLFGIEWSRLHPRNLKRQQRKFVWTRARKVAALTLGITGIVMGRWMYASMPPTVILPPKTPETLAGPNAQHFYAAGMEALSDNASKQIEEAYSTIDQGTRTAQSLAERRAAVQVGTPALALLRQGFNYQFQNTQNGWNKQQDDLYKLSAPVPNFVKIRGLTRLMAVEASVLAADGKYAAAVSSSLDAIRFGQDVGKNPTLIAGMIGTLCQHIGSKEALLYVNQLTASEARQAIPRVAQLIENEPTAAQIIENDRLFGNGSFQEMMAVKPTAALEMAGVFSSEDPLEMVSLIGMHIASVFWYTNQGIVDAYNHYMDRVIQQAALPFQQAQFPTEAQRKALPPLAAISVPNFEKAHASITRSQTRNRVLLTQLAVQAYRQEHGGAYPKTLNDLLLAPNPYLTTIPADLFSPTGTDSLRYAKGKVYSVGENGKDESGEGDDKLE